MNDPLLLIDIDGVISLIGFDRNRAASGEVRHFDVWARSLDQSTAP
jgi:hypothetical protein